MNDDLKGLDDERLVALARDGSSEAFAEIYDRHAPGVARALASFAGTDRDLLDDLVQDVFLRVARGLSSYEPSRPFAHWLYTVALNVGRNHARRSATVIPVDPADLDSLSAAGGESDEALSLTRSVARLVARLPLAMREVVSLRVGSEMSYGEIADLLGIPEGTARSRMHNALQLLRGHLGAPDQRRSKEHD